MKKTWQTFLGFFVMGLFTGLLVVTGYDLTPQTILISLIDPVVGQVPFTGVSGVWEVLKKGIPIILLIITGTQLYRVYTKGSVMLSIALLGLFSGIVLFFQPLVFFITFTIGSVIAHIKR